MSRKFQKANKLACCVIVIERTMYLYTGTCDVSIIINSSFHVWYYMLLNLPVCCIHMVLLMHV